MEQQNKRKTKRWLILLTASLGLLVVGGMVMVRVYAAQSQKNWAEAQAAVKAAGETLDFQAILPKRVPPEQNFCALPALDGLAIVDERSEDVSLPRRRERFEKLRLIPAKKGKYLPSSSMAKVLPPALKDYAAYYVPEAKAEDETAAAHALLGKLTEIEALSAELAAGLDRPYAQWTPCWEDRPLSDLLVTTPMPHMMAQLHLARSLPLHARACLQVGRRADAVRDLRVLIRLCEAALNEAFVLGNVLAVGRLNDLYMGVWGLCADASVTLEDLELIDQEIRRVKLKEGALLGFRGEMIGGVDAALHNKIHNDSFFGDEKTTDDFWVALFRSSDSLSAGFKYDNAAEIAKCHVNFFIQPLKQPHWSAAIAGSRAAYAWRRDIGGSLVRGIPMWLAFAHVKGVNAIILPMCKADGDLALCRAALALAKLRVTQGGYPEKLEAAFIDPVSGLPLGYRKLKEGYLLWSVGVDLKDDGGALHPDVRQKPHSLDYTGDWVWEMR